MKLCIPVATPEGLAAALEPDFGAAQHLVIIEDDGQTLHAVDRAKPELISEDMVSGIQGVICGEIHPRLLYELQQNGIQVFGCEASTAGEALTQFHAGELEAAPPFSLPADMQGEGCGCGHNHDSEACGCSQDGDDHECCGGKGHDNPDHECCGGKGQDGGKGHGGGCGCGH